MDPLLFAEHASGIKLRQYQRGVAEAVVESVRLGLGLSFVIIFPRQSGKNELQAQIEAYLLVLFSQIGAEIVKVSPTWEPQSLNAMRRLERVLQKNLITNAAGWCKEQGRIYRIGLSRIYFLSGSPTANVVGATASTLLEVDEAQDVSSAKFDKDVSPMAASTNATKVFWGTSWTSQTLLAREMRAGLEAEKRDGRRRVWRLSAEDVGREVPAYAQFVAEQVAKLGRSHPLVRTQFFSEEIDSGGGLFPPARRALMVGQHAPEVGPAKGSIYCGLLDVAGEDEGINDLGGGEAHNQGRDSTALTIVRVNLAGLADPLIKAPAYEVVARFTWLGVKHSTLYSGLGRLASLWGFRWLVVDATGVGAGLASFLAKALPGKVIPFVFTGSSKSGLGWDYLAVVESGRWREYVGRDELQAEFYRQLEYCQYEIQPGPDRRMKWGVPDGTRDFATGELVHDDLVLSAALSAELDRQEWIAAGPTLVVKRADPIVDLDRGF
jgi:hypothetical protein